jgi:hypothetical protein
MTQPISSRVVQFQAHPYRICGGQTDNVASQSPSALSFTSHCDSTKLRTRSFYHDNWQMCHLASYCCSRDTITVGTKGCVFCWTSTNIPDERLYISLKLHDTALQLHGHCGQNHKPCFTRALTLCCWRLW